MRWDFLRATTSDCHWLPQVAYTAGPGVSPCDHILHLETIEYEWDQIFEGRTKPIPRMAVKRIRFNTSPCQLQADSLNPRVADRIKRLYAMDFAKLGYVPSNLLPTGGFVAQTRADRSFKKQPQ